eukprot:CAMPEP_0115355240 /NCGR_PEP_ID=MMETSP0270-20121206/99004_1 /TAXON_ID=71861 /ORGANISM="Scrippsiella trochoidea, Strain CCMP3099" /LENGTH=227 /DNA_ID=CAMNT_0002777607 /DNA_START=72 /DNA_END=751 /DNA_ORIENTATION=-
MGNGSVISSNTTNATSATNGHIQTASTNQTLPASPAAPAPIGNGSKQGEEWALGGPGGACLCLFDIDRTLTGKQSVASPTCPQNSVQHNVYDSAYGRGDLTLSGLGQHVGSTACARCKLGIVSHGTAGGNSMKAKIRSLIQGSGYIPNRWSYPNNIDSPLVLGCSYKPSCVRGVVDWYNRQGSGISPNQVYMFDDIKDNVESFHGTGFNAHQVSCSSRDWGEGGRIG